MTAALSGLVEAATGFLRYLTGLSPAAAILAAVIVALALVVIVYAATSGIFDDRRNAKQKTDFQAQLLASLKLLTDSNTALRDENVGLREDMGRLMTTVDLTRNQNRRVIELLRGIVEGRIAASAIQLAEIEAGT